MLITHEAPIGQAALPARINLRAIFGNDRPVELEIGCGKGGFLLRQAQAHPDRNYLGIEWANEFYKFAVDRMARRKVPNVRILRADAKHVVIHELPDASLTAIHVYHPDPWPKKRHHKRRLFTPEFVRGAIRVLAPGGRLAIQTDHAEYFEQIVAVTSNEAALTPMSFDNADFGTIGERVETNFEIKYAREGRPIHRLAFRRS